MQAEAVISQLSTLDKTDLLKVRQLTEILLGGNTNADQNISNENESILFEAVKAELAANGFNGRIPYSTLKESNFYKTWGRGLTVVNQFIDQHFKEHITRRVQHIALCRILIAALLAELKRQHIPPSLGSIARNLHRVPQAFDNQFPNYLQSGLAYMVLKAMSVKCK